MTVCSISTCDKTADWSVAILLFPPAPFKGMPARREMPHKLCTEHAQAVSVRDFVDDEHWVDIQNSFRRKGYKIPDRDRCQLSFKKMPLASVTNLRTADGTAQRSQGL